MQKIFFLLSFTAIAFLTGCSSSPTSPTNNNNNTITSDTTSYLPIAIGNTWIYSGSVGTYTVSIGADTTFNGHHWNFVTNSAASGHGYIRKEGAIYYEFAPPGYIIPGEVIALNETPASTWTWTINGATTNQYVYTNSAQGLTRTVLGKTYSNVIDVRMDFTFSLNGTVISSGTYHYYYAKGVGLIDSDLGAQGDQPLSSYTLK